MKTRFALLTALMAVSSAFAQEPGSIYKSLTLSPPEQATPATSDEPDAAKPDSSQKPKGMDLARHFASSCMRTEEPKEIVKLLEAEGAVPFPDETIDTEQGQVAVYLYGMQAELRPYFILFDEAYQCAVFSELQFVDLPYSMQRIEELLLERLKWYRVEEPLREDATLLGAYEVDAGGGKAMRVLVYKALNLQKNENLLISRKTVLLAPKPPSE